MNKTMGAMRYTSAVVNLDDVLIPSKTVEEGLERLKEVLKVFQDEGLTLNPKKCQFLMTTTTFLGFEINESNM